MTVITGNTTTWFITIYPLIQHYEIWGYLLHYISPNTPTMWWITLYWNKAQAQSFSKGKDKITKRSFPFRIWTRIPWQWPSTSDSNRATMAKILCLPAKEIWIIGTTKICDARSYNGVWRLFCEVTKVYFILEQKKNCHKITIISLTNNYTMCVCACVCVCVCVHA